MSVGSCSWSTCNASSPAHDSTQHASPFGCNSPSRSVPHGSRARLTQMHTRRPRRQTRVRLASGAPQHKTMHHQCTGRKHAARRTHMNQRPMNAPCSTAAERDERLSEASACVSSMPMAAGCPTRQSRCTSGPLRVQHSHLVLTRRRARDPSKLGHFRRFTRDGVFSLGLCASKGRAAFSRLRPDRRGEVGARASGLTSRDDLGLRLKDSRAV